LDIPLPVTSNVLKYEGGYFIFKVTPAPSPNTLVNTVILSIILSLDVSPTICAIDDQEEYLE